MGGGGPVFLNSAFMLYLVIFLETLAKIDARNLPKIFLTPKGAGGGGGGGETRGGRGGGGWVSLKVHFLFFWENFFPP